MRRIWIVLVVLAVVAAGCARNTNAEPDAVMDPGAVQAAFTARAEKVAALWHGSVTDGWNSGFAPLDPLTIWSESITDAKLKEAAGNGWYTLATSLTDARGNGVIRFAGGQTMRVPVVSAREAYESLATGGTPSCTGCVSLTVTGAKLTTAKIRTSRGFATVPAWAFTIRTLSKPMVRVAVAKQSISPIPQMTDLPLFTFPAVGAAHLTTVDGDRIDYTLSVGACDHDLRALSWESDQIVVLGGGVSRRGDNCIAVGLEKPVSVTLSRPLGDRVLVDVVSGAPLVKLPGRG